MYVIVLQFIVLSVASTIWITSGCCVWANIRQSLSQRQV